MNIIHRARSYSKARSEQRLRKANPQEETQRRRRRFLSLARFAFGGHPDLAWDKIYDSEGLMKGPPSCCGVRCHRRHQLDASLSDSETSLVFRRPGRPRRRRKRWMSGVRLHEKLTPRLEGSLTLQESEALLVPIPIHQLFKLWAHLPDALVNVFAPWD